MDLSKYESVIIALKSHFLFYTDNEYRELLGVTEETLTDNKDDARAMDKYYSILNRECRIINEESLKGTMSDYLEASELFLSLDWGDRKQAASRKKFCQMLFRMAATNGLKMSIEEELKFKIKEADARLIKTFYPSGWGNPCSVNIVYIILFSFGIIRPWVPGNNKCRDLDNNGIKTILRKFAELLILLKEDMPRLGSLEKPLVFDQWLGIVDRNLNDPALLSSCSPLWLVHALTDAGNACLSVVNPEMNMETSNNIIGFRMPGIWIDDKDNGKTRFWIFPLNHQMAYCYEDKGMTWELSPYEFSQYEEDSDPQFGHTCYFFTPEGNEGLFLNPETPLDSCEVAHVRYVPEEFNDKDQLTRISFHSQALPFPQWMNWRVFIRLDNRDPRYARFKNIIKKIYDPRSPLSFVFTNRAPMLTDVTNNLVARDWKYLYVSDYRRPRFIMEEESENEDFFNYEPSSSGPIPSGSILDMEISPCHPLYALPINPDKKRFSHPMLNKLAEIMKLADDIKMICIVHRPKNALPLLYFSGIAGVFPIDMEMLAEFGVRKFTSRAEAFGTQQP